VVINDKYSDWRHGIRIIEPGTQHCQFWLRW
jgi:hypothetical protein